MLPSCRIVDLAPIDVRPKTPAPYESRLSATCMLHRTYINNPDVRYGLQRSPLQYRQKRLCEQEGADMAVTVQTRRERVNADAPKCNN